MDDAFSSLTFPSTSPPTKPQQSKPSTFAAFDQSTNHRSAVVSPQLTSPAAQGGSFFDPALKSAPKLAPTLNPPVKPLPTSHNDSLSLGFGNLGLSSSTPYATQPKPVSASNLSLVDFTESAPQKAAPKVNPVASSSINSAFNLSSPASTSKGPQNSVPTTSQINALSGLSSADPWGSNDAWATSEPSSSVVSTAKPPHKGSSIATTMDFSSWGGAPSSQSSTSVLGNSSGNGPRAAPEITGDEDFGGWTSAAPISAAATKPAPTPSSNVKPSSGYGGSEDLFSNVWE